MLDIDSGRGEAWHEAWHSPSVLLTCLLSLRRVGSIRSISYRCWCFVCASVGVGVAMGVRGPGECLGVRGGAPLTVRAGLGAATTTTIIAAAHRLQELFFPA